MVRRDDAAPVVRDMQSNGALQLRFENAHGGGADERTWGVSWDNRGTERA